MFVKTNRLGHHEIVDGSPSDIGRVRRPSQANRPKPVVTDAMRRATSDPNYSRAAHKLLIENQSFSKLTPAEQTAFNKWRQSIGRPPLS